jgi:hypothetical protein
MNTIITILAALLVSVSGIVKAQDCLWAKSAGGKNTDLGRSTVTDASGNVYVTGYFSSDSITFGTTTLNNSDTSGNNFDIYIVK